MYGENKKIKKINYLISLLQKKKIKKKKKHDHTFLNGWKWLTQIVSVQKHPVPLLTCFCFV